MPARRRGYPKTMAVTRRRRGPFGRIIRLFAIVRIVFRAFRTYRRNRTRLRAAAVTMVLAFVAQLVRRRALPAQAVEPTG